MSFRYLKNITWEEQTTINCIKWLEINFPEIDRLQTCQNEFAVYMPNSEFKGLICQMNLSCNYEITTKEILNFKYIIVKNKKEFKQKFLNYINN